MNRRKFLQGSALTTAGLALGGFGLISCGSAKNNFSSSTTPVTKKRRIGSLEVSPIGLGCMSMAGVYNAPNPKPKW